jgi:predicted RNA-binding protein YlqC (UPF0109 family)
MKDLVEYIAESLVERPGAVRVKEQQRRDVVRYELYVADDDMGRVIGKGGRVANAMRQLLSAAAAAQGKDRVELDIVD